MPDLLRAWFRACVSVFLVLEDCLVKLVSFNSFLSFTDPQTAGAGNGFANKTIAPNLFFEFRSLDSVANPDLIFADLSHGMAAGRQVRA
jgi:hypothetical protein